MPYPSHPRPTPQRRIPSTLALAWGLASALTFGAAPRLAVAQAPATAGAEPRVPGAIVAQPAWLTDTPFDLKKYFAMPPAAENAAPLYLEALAEFTGDVETCFPPARKGAADAGRALSKRWASTVEDWVKNPASVPPKQVDALLADHAGGFRKLDIAQARPRCVFAIGLGLDSLLPHAQAMREVARVLAIRAGRSLDRDDVGAALADLGRLLRLSRDVRPRGVAITSLVSVAIDAVALDQVLTPILAARKLKPEHCDRLLKLLADHESQGQDPFAAGVMGEYVLGRSVLHRMADGSKTVAGPDGRPVEEKLDRPALLREMIALTRLAEGKEATPAALAEPEALSLAREALNRMEQDAPPARAALDDYARSLLAAPAGYRARVAAFDGIMAAYPPGTPVRRLRLLGDVGHGLVSASSRDAANLGAARCLVALRRWQMMQGKPAADLAEACRAAKLAGVPADPFGTGPLKMVVAGGETVVYSVGADGTDDAGQVDNEKGRKPRGDLIYRLPKRK